MTPQNGPSKHNGTSNRTFKSECHLKTYLQIRRSPQKDLHSTMTPQNGPSNQSVISKRSFIAQWHLKTDLQIRMTPQNGPSNQNNTSKRTFLAQWHLKTDLHSRMTPQNPIINEYANRICLTYHRENKAIDNHIYMNQKAIYNCPVRKTQIN